MSWVKRISARKLARRLSCALLPITLCGCLQTTVDTQAVQDVPDRFAFSTRSNVPDTASSAEFWAAFRSPELASLIRRGEEGSLDIAVAIARIDQAAAVRDQAVGGLLPSGGGSASYTAARASALAAGLPDGYVLPTSQLYQLGLSATYEIDFWGKNAALLRASDNALRASRFDAETVRLTVTARIATLYMFAVALNDQIAIAGRNIKLTQSVADGIRQRVEAGSATSTDKARQDTLVLQQQAVVPRLQRALIETEVQIAILLGDPPGRLTIRGGSLDRLALPVMGAGIPTDLLRRRPDIAAAEARLLAAADNVTAARGAMLPSLSLAGQVGQQSPQLATLFSPSALAYQTVAGLVVPLFDQVKLAAQLRGTQAVQDQLIATYRAAIIAGIGDVEAALADLRTIRREEALLAAAAGRARQAYAMSSEQLDAGQIDLTSVLLTQTTYFQALGDLKQIQLTRFQAAVALFKALGGGWTARDLEAAKLAATSAVRCVAPAICS
jgi:NodT family efflux transporter outer membrane factor (OMF) lipoprotein